jgi:beta-galactosidase
MDLYRLPKMAAYFYRSQKAPSDEIVLQAATNWTMGDRSGGGNNPLTVFSNCEEIEVFIGDEAQGRFQPDVKHYSHLPYPPFTVRWPEPYNPWGTAFQDLTVRGYVGGTAVAEHKIDSAHIPYELRLTVSSNQLKADGADMARAAMQVVDKYGNVLPYQMRAVQLILEGDAELIGENPLVLLGGQGACYIKSLYMAGTVTVHAYTDGLPAAVCTINIRE